MIINNKNFIPLEALAKLLTSDKKDIRELALFLLVECEIPQKYISVFYRIHKSFIGGEFTEYEFSIKYGKPIKFSYIGKFHILNHGFISLNGKPIKFSYIGKFHILNRGFISLEKLKERIKIYINKR